MNNQDYLSQLRDNALQKIRVGKERFNTATTVEQKQQSYAVFWDGLQNLMQYSKQESNPEIVNMVKQKLLMYMDEADQMKGYLKSVQPQQQAQSPQIQQQQQNYNTQQKTISAPNQTQNNNQYINKQQQYNDANPNPNASQVDDGKPKMMKENQENNKLMAGLSDAIITAKPNIKFCDVAGLENAKKALNEAVMLPIKFPDFFQGIREPWRGILLYGPPGTGKTFLAKACAAEVDATFFAISSSDLISKFVGESEKLIKLLFQMARESKPSIIFIDEIDSMTGSRSDGESEASRRVKTEFLVQMQGVGKDDHGILVLGATNLPWALDPAIRRRFERRIYIPLPDYPARIFLFQNSLKNTPNSLSQQQLEYLAYQSEGYSGSDITTIVRDASFEPLRKCQNAKKFKKIIDKDGVQKYTPCSPSDPMGEEKNFLDLSGQLKVPEIDIEDFNLAFLKCKPSVAKEDCTKHDDWTKQFGQGSE